MNIITIKTQQQQTFHYQYIAPLFAGCKLNNEIISDFVIEQGETQDYITSNITCIKSGIILPKANNFNRGPIVSAGFTQVQANKISENQNILDNEYYEIPVKMLFDDTKIIKVRQTSTWLGKFYGFHFPIREQTEVLILFTDPLLSIGYIVSCYFNKSNSDIFKQSQVGIKTATISTTSSEKIYEPNYVSRQKR